MRKRLFKKVVAGIALTAMLLQTGLEDYSMVANVYAAETSSGEEIEVDTSILEQAEETAVEETNDSVEVDASSEEISVAQEVTEEEFNIPVEENEVEHEKTLVIDENSIIGEGYTDLEIEVSAEDLPRLTYYGLKVYTNADAFFNGQPIEENYIESLSSYTDSLYISNLDYNHFEMYFVGESTSDIYFDYTVESVENGTVSVKVTTDAVEEELEEAEEELEETDYSLEAESDGIYGYGYESVSVSVKAFMKNADGADNSDISLSPYYIYVGSDAEEVTINGNDASEGIKLDDENAELTIEGLDGESFVVYAVAAYDDDDMAAKYIVKSAEDGAAKIELSFESEEAIKRVYEYEDNKVSVVATLSDASAIPDDADFIVKEVTPSTGGYNYDAYMQALNDNAEAISGEDANVEYTEDNTLLYDIGFFGYDKDDNYVELQPRKGTVKIRIQFKQRQLENELSAESNNDISIVHLPLVESVKESVDTTADATDISVDDIKVEVVADSASIDGESADFVLSDFSLTAVIDKNGKKHIKPGKSETFETVLGDAHYYGIVANSANLNGHLESNMAVGTLSGNAHVQSCKNDGGSAGVTMIGAYTGNNFKMTGNGNNTDVLIYAPESAVKNFGHDMTMINPWDWDQFNWNTRKPFYPNEYETPKGVVINMNKYSEADIKSKVSSLVGDAKIKSAALETEGDKAGYDYSSIVYAGNTTGHPGVGDNHADTDKPLLDIINMGVDDNGKVIGGTYYINFKNGEFANAYNLVINLASSQNVVLNIPDTYVSINQIHVYIDGVQYSTKGDANEDPVCQKVIFNCPNATTGRTANTDGVFLFPNTKDFGTSGVTAGWVIADKITQIGGSEWHCTWHDMPKPDPVSCDFTIKGVKTVNGADPAEGESIFTFELYDNSGNLLQSVKNNGSEVKFNPLVFSGDYSATQIKRGKNDPVATEAFIYRIKEKQESIDGYILSQDEYQVTVYVHTDADKANTLKSIYIGKKKADGSLEQLYWNSPNVNTADYIKFDNTHEGLREPAEFTLKVHKTFKGDWDPNSDLSKVTVKIEPITIGGVTSGVVADENKLNWTDEVILTPNNPEATFGTFHFEPNFDRSKGWGWNDTYSFDIEDPCRYRTNFDCYMFKITETVPADSSATVEMDIDTEGLPYTVFEGDKGTRYIKLFVNTLTDNHDNYRVGLDVKIKGNTVPNDTDKSKGGVCEGLTGPVEFVNRKTVEGKLELAKLDQNATSFAGKKLAATFAILKEDGTTPVYITGSNGQYECVPSTSNVKNNQFSVPADGTVSISKLPTGTYTIVEVTAPEGYVVLQNPVRFTVSASGTTTTDTSVVKAADANDKYYLGIGIKDTRKKVNFALHKREAAADGTATTTPVTKAKFTLVGVDNGYRQTNIEVNADGNISFTDLPWGTYTLTESVIPEGYEVYQINGASMSTTFTVDKGVITGSNISVVSSNADGSETTYQGTVYNRKNTGDILLYKYGKDGMDASAAKTALANIKFKLTDNNGNAVKLVEKNSSTTADGISVAKYYEYASTGSDLVLTTDANGYIYIKGLSIGNYKLVEQSPFATEYGYKVPQNATTGATVSINTVTKVEVENNSIEATVEFTKVDSKNTGVTLAGATFELYKQNGTSYASTGKTYTSVADGKIKFTGLSAGRYYAKETQAPQSYIGTYDGTEYVVYFEIPVSYKAGDAITLQAATLSNGVPTVVSGAGVLDGSLYKNDEGTGSASLHKIKKTTNPSTGAPVTSDFAGVKFVLKHDTGSRWRNVLKGTVTADVVNGAYVYTGTSASGTELVTNANGDISISNLPWGDYYFQEVATSGVTDNYTILTEDWCKNNLRFSIDKNGDSASFNTNVINEIKKGYVKIEKRDADANNAIIEDDKIAENGSFVFDIYNANDVKVVEGVETVNGIATVTTPLDYGHYYFVETRAIEGYTLPTVAYCKENYGFDINDSTVDNAKTVTVSAYDYHTRNGEITINKTGTYGSDFVPTATTVPVTFALYSKTNHEVSFSARVRAIVAKIFNEAGYYPYGEYTFNLTKSATANVYAGSYKIENLPWDEYYLVEVEAPDGLSISKEQKSIKVGSGPNHLVYSFDVENTPAPGGAKLAKHDFETGAIINNGTAKFDVYKKLGATIDRTSDTKIRENITTVSGVAHVGNLQPGDYYFVETEAPVGYTCDSTINYTFTITENQTTEVEATPDKALTGVVNGSDISRQDAGKAYNKEIPASVSITKYRDSVATNNEYDGVTFYVERDLGLTHGSWTMVGSQQVTKDGGKAEFDNLPWGTYRIVEILPAGNNAPNGFTLTNDKTKAYSAEFELGQGTGKTLEYSLNNIVNTKKKAKVQLKKLDERNRGLAGAEFKLYKENGTWVEDITSTENAWTSSELEIGKYYFVETKAPNLYSITEPTGFVTVEASGMPASVADGYRVQTITNDNGSKEYRFWFAIADTDLSGKVDGAVINDFTLEVKNERHTGSFGLKKVDVNTYRTNTAAGLAGAEFLLTDSDNNAVKVIADGTGYKFDADNSDASSTVIATDANGEAHVSGLPTGTYTLSETKAPANYPLLNTTWTVEITKDSNNTALITNPIKNGTSFTSFTFAKKDVANANVSGAVFSLYKKNAEGSYVYENRDFTSANGAVTVTDLYAGDYYVVELKSKQATGFAYVASETPYYFRVAFDADDVPEDIDLYTDSAYKVPLANNTVINDYKTTKLTVEKVSLDDASIKLTGAEFALYDGAALKETKAVTNTNGTVEFDNLEVGHTYKLIETKAPNGYRLPAEIQDETRRAAMLTALMNASVCTPSSVLSASINADQKRLEYSFTVTSENVTGAISVVVPNAPKVGAVNLRKVDANDNTKTLSGAKFALYKNGELKYGPTETNSNGLVSFADLPWGTYDIVETQAPAGYPLVMNYPETGTKVGKKIQTIKIGINETNGEKLEWSFTGDGNSITNEHDGGIYIKKTDSTDNKPMGNVTFILRKEGDAAFSQNVVTDANGAAYVSDLGYGSYYFDEEVPTGYAYDETYTTTKRAEYNTTKNYKRFPATGFITITEANPVSGTSQSPNGFVNDRQKGKVLGYKVNQYGEKVTGNPATFRLYSKTSGTGWELVKSILTGEKDAWLLGEVQSDANGEIKIGYADGTYFTDGIPFGNYVLIETGHPAGYDKNESVSAEFSISKDNPVTVVEIGNIVNTEQKLSFTLKKNDESGNKLTGATFALYKEDGTKIEEHALSGDNASAAFIGTEANAIRYANRYYLVETVVPDGYKKGGSITAPAYMGFENAADGKYAPVYVDSTGEYRYYFTPTIDAAKNIVDGKSITVTAQNEKGYGTVIIEKKFDGTAPANLTGIVFGLKDANDTNAQEYTATTNSVGKATFTNIPFGTYTLREVSVPAGMSYAVSTVTKQVTISDANRTASGEFVAQDDFLNSSDQSRKARVELYKVSNMIDSKGNKIPVQGMKFNIYNAASDSVVTNITTDGTGHAVLAQSNALPKGNYYIQEDAAEAVKYGFVPSTTKYYFTITDANADSAGSKIVPLGRTYAANTDGSWTISNFVSASEPIINEVQLGKVTLVKKNAASGAGITGAKFDLYKKGADGKYAVYESDIEVDSASGIVRDNLPWGSYYFVETEAPEGFVIPKDADGGDITYNFVIGPENEVGSAHISYAAEGSFTFEVSKEVENAPEIVISKQILNTTTLLEGANLVLKTGEGYATTVASWTTNATDKKFVIGNGVGQLRKNTNYRLEETSAPSGYALAEPVDFTITASGTLESTNANVSANKVVMYDAPNITIDKFVTGTTNRLAGATLAIYNGTNKVEEFDTKTNEGHVVEANLVPGTTYTLKETSVPAGYLPAKDVEFTVNADGTVNVTGGATNTDSVAMYDKPFEVIINKVLSKGDMHVAGATLAIVEFDTGSIVSNAGSIVTTGKPILLRSGVADNYADAAAKAEDYQVIYGVGLECGKTYAVLEKVAPAGYILPESKSGDTYGSPRIGEFTVGTDADAYVAPFSCTVRNHDFRLIVSKEYNGEVINGAELKIVDVNGNSVDSKLDNLVVTSGKKFMITALNAEQYASVYGDAADYNMIYGVALDPAAIYYLKETKAPAGYTQYDSNGVEIKIAGFETSIVMEDTPVEIILQKLVATDNGNDENLAGAHMILVDSDGNKIWPTDKDYYTTTRKPVIFTQRELTDAEKEIYDVNVSPVKTPVLEVGKTYTWRELGTVRGFLNAEEYYAGSGESHEYIEQSFRVTNGDIKSTVRTINVYNKKVGKLEIAGTKDWKRTSVAERCQITVGLYRSTTGKFEDAELVDSKVLATNVTTFSFQNLDRYKYGDGEPKEYTYFLTETMSDAKIAANFEWKDSEGLEEYKNGDTTIKYKKITFTDGQNRCDYTIENYPVEKVDIPVTKEWVLYRNADGTVDTTKQYADVTIYLKQNNARIDSFIVKNGGLTNEEPGVTRHVFKDLPKYDELGNLYNYTVEEVGIDESVVKSLVTPMEYEFKITNRPFDDPFYISGRKVWVAPVDEAKPQVEIVLYRDGKEFDRTDLDPVTDTFEFGPMYEYNLGWGATDSRIKPADPTDTREKADGHKYVYTLKEFNKKTGKELEDYVLEVDFNGTIQTIGNKKVAEATLTNTKKPEFITLSGFKYWDDAGDASKRPTVTVNLYKSDSEGNVNVFVDSCEIPNTSNSYSFGTPGKIQLPKYDKNGQIIIYRVDEVALPGYISNKEGNNFRNTPSKVRISKVDATNSAELPGAVLSITDKATGREVERWTSTTTPHYVEGLTLGGTYILTEISAPRGYDKVDSVEFTVNTNGVLQTVTMTDPRIVGSVKLTKTDADTGATLAGAAFNLYTSEGALVNVVGSAGSYEYVEGSATTRLLVNDAGTLTVEKLPYGEYYFREVTAPAGYELSAEARYFTVSSMGAETEVTFLNRQIRGRARLMKVSGADGTPLAGATFELYAKTPRSAGQAIGGTLFSDVYYLYGTYVTDRSGIISVSDLPWDDYYFIETEAPEGYVLNLDTNGDPLVYTFTVDASSASTTVAIDLGSVTNMPEGGGGGAAAGTGTTPTPGGGGAAGGVAGVRRLKGSGIGGVLGVRSKPTSGVLGVRVGPTTGDAANIALWLILLLASVGVVIAICIQAGKKGKSRK